MYVTDHLTPEKRSLNMSKIRSKNTKPEMIVRKMLHNSGIRYRLYAKDLPGKPDLSNKSKKFAIFVNGCFWHQHKGCSKANIPKSNTEYWIPKLNTNIKRFEKNLKKLREMHFKTIVIWECQINNSIYNQDLKKLLFE